VCSAPLANGQTYFFVRKTGTVISKLSVAEVVVSVQKAKRRHGHTLLERLLRKSAVTTPEVTAARKSESLLLMRNNGTYALLVVDDHDDWIWEVEDGPSGSENT
jgi:hypothetical protein